MALDMLELVYTFLIRRVYIATDYSILSPGFQQLFFWRGEAKYNPHRY